MPTKYFPIDAATGLIKRAAAQSAITATAYIGTQHDQGAAAATDMALVINVEAIDVASANETYTFRVVGSNVADRSDGQILGWVQMGHASTLTIETRNTAAGDQFFVEFRTEKNDTAFRYVDLHLLAAGTTPSITFNAYMTKRN